MNAFVSSLLRFLNWSIPCPRVQLLRVLQNILTNFRIDFIRNFLILLNIFENFSLNCPCLTIILLFYCFPSHKIENVHDIFLQKEFFFQLNKWDSHLFIRNVFTFIGFFQSIADISKGVLEWCKQSQIFQICVNDHQL